MREYILRIGRCVWFPSVLEKARQECISRGTQITAHEYTGVMHNSTRQRATSYRRLLFLKKDHWDSRDQHASIATFASLQRRHTGVPHP